MALRICEVLSIVLTALVAGVFWGPWLGLSRSIDTFSGAEFLAIGKRMIANLAPVMPILMPAAMAATLALLVVSYRGGTPTFFWTLAGFVMFAVALLITLRVEVPIDNRIRRWSEESLPPDWQALRDRWERYHALRTFSSIVGFVAIVIGAAW